MDFRKIVSLIVWTVIFFAVRDSSACPPGYDLSWLSEDGTIRPNFRWSVDEVLAKNEHCRGLIGGCGGCDLFRGCGRHPLIQEPWDPDAPPAPLLRSPWLTLEKPAWPFGFGQMRRSPYVFVAWPVKASNCVSPAFCLTGDDGAAGYSPRIIYEPPRTKTEPPAVNTGLGIRGRIKLF